MESIIPSFYIHTQDGKHDKGHSHRHSSFIFLLARTRTVWRQVKQKCLRPGVQFCVAKEQISWKDVLEGIKMKMERQQEPIGEEFECCRMGSTCHFTGKILSLNAIFISQIQGQQKIQLTKKKNNVSWISGANYIFFFFFLMTAEFKILSELTPGQYLSRQGAWGSSGEGERPG